MTDRPELTAAANLYAAAVAVRQQMRDLLAEEVRAALDVGMTESEVARVAGVTRMTVRAWRAA